MKKKFLITASIIVAALALTGCNRILSHIVYGEGDRVSVDANVTDFTGISAGGIIEVVYINAPQPAARLYTYQNLQDYFGFNVRNGVLNVQTRRNSPPISGMVRLYVYAPYLDYISLSGSARATNWDEVHAGSVRINLSGATRGEFELHATNLDINASGSGNITLLGSANNLDISASGASTVEASQLFAHDADVTASGSARVGVFINDSLNATASGASRITYKTYDDSISAITSTSGSGRIMRSN